MEAERQPDAAIELVGVTKKVRGELILDDVGFVVPRGQITVLIGPSGAGKTVTIKHILGLVDPTGGTVRVEGHDLARLSEEELNDVRRYLSVVLQGTLPFSCGLFFSMNVYENVAFALRERQPRWPEERVDEVTMDHLRLVGLGDYAMHMPDQLSSGMAKRVALARALALNARILIIDDFDSGLDGVRLALLCELIQDVQVRTGATLLVTTHDMTAAKALADHVAVIHEGRIVASGPAEAIFTSDKPIVGQLIAGELEGPIRLRSS